jgi:hypothetical protein
VARARLGRLRWRHETMTATSEDAVREYVQAGQDGDQRLHGAIRSNRVRLSRAADPHPRRGTHSLAQQAFPKPMHFRRPGELLTCAGFLGGSVGSHGAEMRKYGRRAIEMRNHIDLY